MQRCSKLENLTNSHVVSDVGQTNQLLRQHKFAVTIALELRQ